MSKRTVQKLDRNEFLFWEISGTLIPTRFVKTPDGKLALFSTVVDFFVWYNMTDEEAIELCAEKVGLHGERAVKKVNAAKKDPDRWLRELKTIRRVHGRRKFEKHMEEIGFMNWPIVYEVMVS